MKKLPIENEILKQITIFGNGKDGELTIETTERTFLLALADHTNFCDRFLVLEYLNQLNK